MYSIKNGKFYSIPGGYINIPQPYKSRDKDNNLVVSAQFFKDYPAVKNALTTYLPDYEKTGDVYSQLSAHTTNALQNAKRVEQYHLQNGSSKPFGIAVNPFTDIYQLVESLL